ncbi:MAG: flagellar biosynthesis protein FlhA [Chitinispirillia bacterium]|nr:flagellar biosynthesis protein FlhA [Chitinispirillia bacterium]MCL2268629.1 flagellar biosynthesis protein FlhA [Chitinispirillia bacterium]
MNTPAGAALGGSVGAITNFLMNVGKHRDLMVVIGVISIVVILVIPVPTFFIDILLTLNLCIALLILLVSMYTKESLEFSVFPALLLTITLFRLSLNVATLRLILGSNPPYAGQVIDTFGGFVTGDNIVVGVIIFLILVLINFIVITKGAGRIAEVAARFTLDAMPGKQMAIDADLNAGLINEEQARSRREKISRESEFHGAMDGASKFVRGDAIAGIIIIIVQIVGGFIIGVAMNGMNWEEAIQAYTRLTIGDGLMSQIPALMISVGAGMIVSRSASEGNLGMEITNQLFANPKVMWVAGALMTIFALIPGFPKPPFIILGGACFAIAYVTTQRAKSIASEAKASEAAHQQTDQQAAKPKDEPVESYLHVDPMELEIGYGLIPIVDAKQGGDLLERITHIRKVLATELGIIIPPIRIRDNIQLTPNEYKIKIRTVVVGKGELMSGAYLAMDPGTATRKIRGVPTVEPAFNLPAIWITESQKSDAEVAGYTVVELPAVLATHLTETIKKHSHEILTRQNVKTLVDNIGEQGSAVIEELIPRLMTLGDVHKVLQNLLRERVSIRDLMLILETLANVAARTKNSDVLTEYVRNALAPQICEIYKNDEGVIPVITLDPNLEAKLEGAIQERDGVFHFSLSPVDASRILEALGEQIELVKQVGEYPILICSPTVRPQLKRLTETNFQELVVLSYNEIVAGVEIRSLGMVSTEGA